MASTRSTDSIAEMYRGLLTQVAQAKAAQDAGPADLETLINIETTLLSRLKQPLAAAQQNNANLSGVLGGAPTPPPPTGGLPGGPPGGLPGGLPPQLSGVLSGMPGARGLSLMPPTPPVDELRRILTPGRGR